MRIKVLGLLCCLLAICGCVHDKFIIQGYQSSSEHFDEDAWRDHTHYCEYYYKKENISLFEKSQYYTQVTHQDIQRLKGFVGNFKEWIALKDGYKNWYHFNEKQISINDYFHLEVKAPDEVYGEYHCYDIYYFDVNECTLYYMSSYS